MLMTNNCSSICAGRTFEKSGDFRIETTGSAPEAIEKIQNTSYDAIVSDYQIPGMDGIVFLKEVRSRFGDIPFILFTGKGREEIAIEAINNGADFYLQKGGDPESQFAELAHKIRKAVERRRAIEELRDNESQLRLLQFRSTRHPMKCNGWISKGRSCM